MLFYKTANFFVSYLINKIELKYPDRTYVSGVCLIISYTYIISLVLIRQTNAIIQFIRFGAPIKLHLISVLQIHRNILHTNSKMRQSWNSSRQFLEYHMGHRINGEVVVDELFQGIHPQNILWVYTHNAYSIRIKSANVIICADCSSYLNLNA